MSLMQTVATLCLIRRANVPVWIKFGLIHLVTRIVGYWIPYLLLHIMQRTGIGSSWRIQGSRMPSPALVARAVKHNMFVDALLYWGVSWAFSKLLTCGSAPKTPGQHPEDSAHHRKAEELFALADLNKDRVLTKSEMKKFAHTSEGAPLKELFSVDEQGWRGMWQIIDQNRDNQFSREEFVAAYVKAASSVASDRPMGWAGLRLGGPSPSIRTHIWQVAVGYIGYDAMFYWSHRLLYHRSIYKYCHKQVLSRVRTCSVSSQA